jgi:exodeoxyribonuclease VII small subunit
MEKKELSFEEKLNNLEKIVSELEQGNIDLDDAINKYTEAMKLAKECSKKLDEATKAVNKILAENGKLEDFKELEKDTE